MSSKWHLLSRLHGQSLPQASQVLTFGWVSQFAERLGHKAVCAARLTAFWVGKCAVEPAWWMQLITQGVPGDKTDLFLNINICQLVLRVWNDAWDAGDGHTTACLECTSINNQVLLLIIAWWVWQGTLAVGRVKGRVLVRYSGLGENVLLWTLLNTETYLPRSRDSWLASQHVQHVGSVHQPYTWGKAEPLTGGFVFRTPFCIIKLSFQCSEGTVPGGLGLHFHDSFDYR